MRKLPQGLQQHLDSGAATMCHCWRLKRQDGVVMGYTDHDRSLNFDGTVFESNSGFSAARAESQLGLAIGGTEVSGALVSPSLTESDLANGVYDNASVEIWIVNWNDSTQRVLLDIATVGEIRRSEQSFTAELRGLAHLLDQERGRLYQSSCSADLGDQRCRADLTGSLFTIEASVTEVLSEIRLKVDVSGYGSGWFSAGRMEFLSGANAGAWQTIESFGLVSGEAIVRLWNRPALDVVAGDQIRLIAGCDKNFATCRDKFNNLQNFRGFPHIPGNDALISHPGSSDGPMDGGSLYR